MLPPPNRRNCVADEIEQDEVFDEEDLAEGFDGDDLETEELDGDELVDVEGADVEGGVLVVDDDEDDATDAVAEADATVVDDEDDLNLDQDVELALDEVLAETMRLNTETDDDEDAAPEVEDKTDPAESVLPKQDDEFRCKSCRLLKKMSQLADDDRTLCRDCV